MRIGSVRTPLAFEGAASSAPTSHPRTRLLVVVVALMALITIGIAEADARDFRAAAGKVEITPTGPCWIAGYGSGRRSRGVHDPLSAKCLVLDDGTTRIAFVACDLMAFPRFEGMKVRALVKSVPSDRLYISATHTHSGPDVMGQWGPTFTQSGVDQAWMDATVHKIAALVDETTAKLQPAELKFANTTEVPRISKNIRVPQILDTELGVMQVLTPSGKPIATFVNYACHPEILNNKLVTADFPHWLYETVEGKTGAPCLYLNGAQGGMITADYDEHSAPKGENWQAAETIGTGMGNRVLDILEPAAIVKNPTITALHRVFEVPMENKRFKLLITLGIFPPEAIHDGSMITEVNRITVGPAELFTLPGEVLPNIGFYLKRHMSGHPKFLLGLCCDELGYILTDEDYGLQLYGYETSESLGPQMEPMMVKNLLSMTAGTR